MMDTYIRRTFILTRPTVCLRVGDVGVISWLAR
jgi:hypothetical protein